MNSYRLEARKADGGIINRGTAWVIDRGLIVTAFHVVADSTERWLHEIADVGYWLVCDDALSGIPLESVSCDSSADLALLKLSTRDGVAIRPSLQPLPVCEWGAAVGSSWFAPGYPELAGVAPVTLTGTVKNVRLGPGGDVFELFVAEGGSESWAGASGSPVHTDGNVIGIILTELPDAATQDAVSVQPALALVRLAQAKSLRARFQDLLANCASTHLRAIALAAILPSAMRMDNSLELAEALAAHGMSYGVRGIQDILEQLPDTQEKRAYTLELAASTFDAEPTDWPRRPQQDDAHWERHTRHSVPRSLEDRWTSFMQSGSWLSSLVLIVDKLSHSVEAVALRRGLPQRLERLNFLAPFRQLCNELVELIDDIEDDIGTGGDGHSEGARDAIARLRDHIHPATPRGTCFFLMGSSGSGKTHFLEWLMRREDSAQLILPVAWPKTAVPTVSSLEGEIMMALGKATGRTFSSLTQFQEALDRLEKARTDCYPEYSHSTLPRRPKLVIAFENLQTVLSDVKSSAATCRALQDLIEDASRHHSVRWLVTLQDTCFDRLTMPVGGPSFWEEYGFIDAIEPANGAPEVVSAKGGWIDLDRICVRDGVGWAILTQAFGADFRAAVGFDDRIGQARLRSGALRRYMALPWFAWILVSMGEEWCIARLQSGDLNHIRIVDELHKKKVLPLVESPSARKQLLRYLKVVAAAMLPGDGRRFDDHNFSNDSEARSIEAKMLFVPDQFREALERFIASNLLKQQDTHQVRLEVEFVMLWGYEGARYLQLVLAGKDSASIIARLCADLASAEDDLLMLKESVLEFLLMFADQEGATGIVDAILAITPTELGDSAAAILFAAPKLSSSVQQRVARFDVQTRATFNSATPGRRLLLATMMFAEWADPAAFAPAERLDLVRAHYRSIAVYGFASYYRAVAFDIINEVADLNGLRACMVSLNGCEQAGLAKDMAIRVVDRLFRMARERDSNGDGFRAVIETIVHYASDSVVAAKADYFQRAAPKSEKPALTEPRGVPRSSWTREFFREWVLQEVCNRLVREREPVPTFIAMKSCGWFDVGGKGDLHIEMEREATLAMGHYFHGAPDLLGSKKSKAGREFIALVNQLVQEDSNARMIAFNLLVHTEPTGGLFNRRISDDFIPLLEILAKDPKVANMARFQGVYKMTVGREMKNARKSRTFRK